jgi:hypothetical protein
VFLHRILHLLSLRNGPAPLEALRRLLDADTAELPPNCLVRLDLEAKEILRALLPRPANAALEMYRGLRDVLGRRPTLLELLQHQVAPRTLCRPPLGWPSFLQSEGDLPPDAVRLLDSGPGRFLRVAETTALNKSYKMVVLRVLLDRDAFWSGLDSEQLCADCHRFLAGHPALRDELGGAAPDPAWIDWWTRWPLRKWLEPQGNRIWFALENGRFKFDPSVPESDRPGFEALLSEIVDYRLARYLERQTASAGTESFVCKVLHAGGRPFLKLPDRVRRSELPEGPTPVQLPSGGEWIFKFVKIACNTASRMGEGANQLPALLREWFGPNAGQPGTRFQVVFERHGGTWRVQPEQTAVIHPAEETLSDPPTLRVAEDDPGSEKPHG